MSAWYTEKHIRDAVESAMRAARTEALAEERARVSRAIFLYGNTLHDERCSEAVLALLPFLYDTTGRAEADHVAH